VSAATAVPGAEPSTGTRGSSGTRGPVRRIAWALGWPFRAVLLALIRLYQVTLSGMLGGHCRFEPSCSVYAGQAIRARGAVVGTGLAAWRVLRCNPFARGGADPAPRSEYDPVIREHAA
jgi:putative membrane protein insertion efficiency factor